MNSYLARLYKYFSKTDKKIDINALQTKTLPQHIAIIMDGNGRWAKKRGLPRTIGHRAGVESLKKIVEACGEIGIKYLTVYAFSTENWKRPKEEVDTLMNLLVEYIEKELDTLDKNGVCIKPIGNLLELPENAKHQIYKAIEKTKNNHKLYLQIALNYGGRRELVHAIQGIVRDVSDGKLSRELIDEQVVSQYLYTAGIPDPDLIIRPSGEMRVSNFLLWQLAYAELWVTNVLWPDFRPEHLLQAIFEYQQRQRRFGAL
ncbi:isoprenyl transferase [Thermanaerosceptrum fracticalcis]|uniref:Isoprenyl transferase n=1 Tax=Thermanaerosceptrum fracticalcis TaxID=1712410 RepID=A0A7G6E0Y2_THEFR|nr:isoprenyl transferase [Thermanaerosceptrum fracticalcis]QNB45736.1 isoprenyl transferase [Thermanaerosceptrum fracticalcis]